MSRKSYAEALTQNDRGRSTTPHTRILVTEASEENRFDQRNLRRKLSNKECLCLTGYYAGYPGSGASAGATVNIEVCAEKCTTLQEGTSPNKFIYAAQRTESNSYCYCVYAYGAAIYTSSGYKTWFLYVPSITMPTEDTFKVASSYLTKVFYMEFYSPNKVTEISFFDELTDPSELSIRVRFKSLKESYSAYDLPPSYVTTNQTKTKSMAKLTYNEYSTNNNLVLERFQVEYEIVGNDIEYNTTFYFAMVTSNDDFILVHIAAHEIVSNNKFSDIIVGNCFVKKDSRLHSLIINVSANSSNTAQVDNLYIKITYDNYLDVVNVTNENSTLYYDPYDWFYTNQTLVIHITT